MAGYEVGVNQEFLPSFIEPGWIGAVGGRGIESNTGKPTEALGAGKHERTGERAGYRNGYR